MTQYLIKRPSKTRFPYWRRRVIQHLIIGLAALASSAEFWRLFSDRRDLIAHLSIATAYPALLLTAAAVLLGPWYVLLGRANPVSFDLRRDLGIWAGIMALLHTAVGLNVHLRGRMWLYFVDEHKRIRHDLFGLGNYTGLLSALLFLLLLAISNDLSLRKLGARTWKSVQRWTYAAVALMVVHGIAYQQIEKRVLPYEVLLWTITAGILVLQFAGWKRTRSKAGRGRSD